MAGSIPPLVSSSPPPLCNFDDEEEEDDDEFGMYAAAEELDYNECISFKEKDGGKRSGHKSRGEQDSTSQDSATDSGLCPDSEGMSPTPHSDDERTGKQSSCDRLCQEPSRLTSNYDSDHRECFESSVNAPSPTLLNGHVDAENHSTPRESDDEFANFENFESSLSVCLPSTEQGIVLNKQSDSNLKHPNAEVNGLTLIPEENCQEEKNNLFQDSSGETSELNRDVQDSIYDKIESNSDTKDGFSCEITEFKQNTDLVLETEKDNTSNDLEIAFESDQSDEMKAVEIQPDNDDDEFDDFTDFKGNFSNSLDLPEADQSDKFSDFPKPFSEQHYSEETVKSLQPPQEDESDDEFSNFADFSSSDCAFVSAQSSNSLENVSHIPVKPSDDLRTDSEFQDWVSVFPSSEAGEVPPGGGASLLREDDVVWLRLFPLESTPALSYQWTESLANRRLLSALNIDSRNILFMPWSNSSVPRFAANLSCGPLEPVKATEALQPNQALPVTPAPSSTLESVPDAHFDWVSSGLTNPLDYPKPVLNLPKTLSTEAENILSSLPDLSFMRKTYIDFPISEG